MVYWDYDYHSEPEPEFVPTPGEHFHINKNEGVIYLNWHEFRKSGQIDQARWLVTIKYRERGLDRGRFKRFRYERFDHVMEIPRDHRGWKYEQLRDHRTELFDWMGKMCRHQWSVHCDIGGGYNVPMRIWFSFEHPDDLMLCKLRWA